MMEWASTRTVLIFNEHHHKNYNNSHQSLENAEETLCPGAHFIRLGATAGDTKENDNLAVEQNKMLRLPELLLTPSLFCRGRVGPSPCFCSQLPSSKGCIHPNKEDQIRSHQLATAILYVVSIYIIDSNGMLYTMDTTKKSSLGYHHLHSTLSAVLMLAPLSSRRRTISV